MESSGCEGSDSTQCVRPFVVAAILRNVTLTAARMESLIELQEKLHQNICSRRRQCFSDQLKDKNVLSQVLLLPVTPCEFISRLMNTARSSTVKLFNNEVRIHSMITFMLYRKEELLKTSFSPM
ncbi:hypothetical protein AHF37_00959 [Paragonimus kellicotti]|nr:hypothetical protein AHF37_00959 [Paragonimus kellicotti]